MNPLNKAVKNRGKAPKAFIEELIAWGKTAPEEIFADNDNKDIYSSVADELGRPWKHKLHRRAVMLEVLRVLGGFESSWKWNEGRDITNSTSGKPHTEEAGIFQCSANSMAFDKSLKDLWKKTTGLEWRATVVNCNAWRKLTKENHAYAIEHTARLLRFTVRHHGPILRKEINPWLSREAVDEFTARLS